MQLSDEQKHQARAWVETGMKLSDFQKRLETEFGVRMTYMEVRLLVDDLKVMPKDPEPVQKPEAVPAEGAPAVPTAPAAPPPPAEGALTAGVKVTVDTVTRPGALASGSVTFSDGQKAQWYLDQMGRFGMVPTQKGYRPSQEDLQDFQMSLDRELQKLGL
ncbi:MAG: hypothetical protein ACKOET_07105 [Verrucomicrobiota bacterium]